MAELNVNIQLICSICGKQDPQLTAGCDVSICTWRIEAMAQIVRGGGDLHVTATHVDKSKRHVSLTVAAWPKTQGNA